MPKNKQCTVTVLIGGVPLPEYTLDNRTYIECILNSPDSYKQAQTDFIGGELEKQEWPVTPYRIEIESHCRETKYFRVLVDGVKVKAIALTPNESKVIKGFRDGHIIREFLFSMPRFAKDTTDRVGGEREDKIGQIEVECWDAECKSSQWRVREKPLNFVQANKKDSTSVTNGEYTMTTSKVGKAIAQRSILRRVDSWKRIRMKSCVVMHYRMGHSLNELGIAVQPLPPKPVTQPELPTGTSAGIKVEIKKEDGVTLSNPDEPIEIFDDDDTQLLTQTGPGTSRKRPALIDLTEDSGSEGNSRTPVTAKSSPSRKRHNRLSRRKRQREAREAEKASAAGADVNRKDTEMEVTDSQTNGEACGVCPPDTTPQNMPGDNQDIRGAELNATKSFTNIVNVIRQMALRSEVEETVTMATTADDDPYRVLDTQVENQVAAPAPVTDTNVTSTDHPESAVSETVPPVTECSGALTTVVPDTNPDDTTPAQADSGMGSFSTQE